MEGELIPREVQNDADALAVVMEADEVSEACALIVVASPAEQEFAAGELRNIVTKRDAIVAKFKKLREPFDIGIAGLKEFFDQPIKRLDEAERVIKRAIVVFQQREHARVNSERDTRMTSIEDQVMTLRAQADEYDVASLIKPTMEEAEDAAQKAADFRRQADDLAQQHVPTELVAKAEGVSTRANWKSELLDIDALWVYANANPAFRKLFKFDESAANNHAKMTKGAVVVPGLRVFNVGTAAVRRNRRSAESPQP